MKDAQARTIYLSDYQAPEFAIDRTDLCFELNEDSTLVTSQLQIRRQGVADAALVLNGRELELVSLAINGEPLGAEDYQVDADSLTIESVPDAFSLTCVTRIYPQQNTSLEGLYKSSGMFCTQCEAEGFRKITYYMDRPDVMSEFTTKIIADASRYPVLLSNGNPVEQGTDGDKHFVVWHDPFPKPAYLFALVGGALEHRADQFTTQSGRVVDIKVYVEAKDLDKCDHAIDSLKRSMRWDEEVYGREYDLDIFMIVAVDDFNMGAMENKGLNIFNTSCVLANPKTTSDFGFQRVEAVVAHEYFHNWSGNRVTCRDWFQLSLKEGFTVYRDSEFSADMGSRAVKRIDDVSLLRTVQFAEDAGPLAHPVRPASYMEISNFYTVTIYEKGAEVVRMIATLLGPDAFRAGSDLYFERHDGQAVTCDDFVKAMEDASGVDLTQFKRWYSQAGTPHVAASSHYDADAKTLSLTLRQTCAPSPGQAEKLPFHIPVKVALIGASGELPLHSEAIAAGETECVLHLREAEQKFLFTHVEEAPVPSLLRGFSAPVKLAYPYSDEQLVHLIKFDGDSFNRWDAAQRYATAVIQRLVVEYQAGNPLVMDPGLLGAFREVLADRSLDPELVARTVVLPTENYLAEISEIVDVHAIRAVREFLRSELGSQLRTDWMNLYNDFKGQDAADVSATAIARRSMANVALGYLMADLEQNNAELAEQQYQAAEGMTDQFAALAALVNNPQGHLDGRAERCLAAFYEQWQHEALVVNQWLAVQAACQAEGGLARVEALMQHPCFEIRNPNKVRSVIGSFSGVNVVNFHAKDGSGYRFLADQIIKLNTLNPQIASRLVVPLTKWAKYPVEAQALMKAELQRLLEVDLAKDVYEIVSKGLA